MFAIASITNVSKGIQQKSFKKATLFHHVSNAQTTCYLMFEFHAQSVFENTYSSNLLVP